VSRQLQVTKFQVTKAMRSTRAQWVAEDLIPFGATSRVEEE
jgi:hypothetical protein